MTQKTKDVTGNSPVRRTNRFFVQMKGYGHCDDKGKTILGIECSGKKITALPDRPMATLFRMLLENWLEAASYSSAEAMEIDLAEFQRYVADLRVERKPR